MTAPTLAAIVEAAAEATYEEARSLTDGDHPMHDMPWASLTGFIQHHWRQEALPTVTATLRALEPLVAEWESDTKEFDQRADEAFSDGGRELAANVYRAIANTNARHALQMRDVIGGVKQ